MTPYLVVSTLLELRGWRDGRRFGGTAPSNQSRLVSARPLPYRSRNHALPSLLCCPHLGRRCVIRRCPPPEPEPNNQQFYCLMNTWHESLASCSAPQENQYTAEALFPSAEPDREAADQQKQQEQDEEHPAAAAATWGTSARTTVTGGAGVTTTTTGDTTYPGRAVGGESGGRGRRGTPPPHRRGSGTAGTTELVRPGFKLNNGRDESPLAGHLFGVMPCHHVMEGREGAANVAEP